MLLSCVASSTVGATIRRIVNFYETIPYPGGRHRAGGAPRTRCVAGFADCWAWSAHPDNSARRYERGDGCLLLSVHPRHGPDLLCHRRHDVPGVAEQDQDVAARARSDPVDHTAAKCRVRRRRFAVAGRTWPTWYGTARHRVLQRAECPGTSPAVVPGGGS